MISHSINQNQILDSKTRKAKGGVPLPEASHLNWENTIKK